MTKQNNGWGGKRPGAGRKPVGDSPKKSQVALRLTADEREFLEGLALHEEITLSEFCRRRLLGEIEEE